MVQQQWITMVDGAFVVAANRDGSNKLLLQPAYTSLAEQFVVEIPKFVNQYAHYLSDDELARGRFIVAQLFMLLDRNVESRAMIRSLEQTAPHRWSDKIGMLRGLLARAEVARGRGTADPLPVSPDTGMHVIARIEESLDANDPAKALELGSSYLTLYANDVDHAQPKFKLHLCNVLAFMGMAGNQLDPPDDSIVHEHSNRGLEIGTQAILSTQLDSGYKNLFDSARVNCMFNLVDSYVRQHEWADATIHLQNASNLLEHMVFERALTGFTPQLITSLENLEYVLEQGGSDVDPSLSERLHRARTTSAVMDSAGDAAIVGKS
jgi:hypothetical protein